MLCGSSRMNGNNGNRSRQNQPVNKMEQAPTHHMERPRRGVRNAANARAAAQAAPQVRVYGSVRTRKAPRKNTPYARPSNNGAKNKAKNKANKTANKNMMKRFKTLSFGPSPIIASHSNPFTVMNHASSRAPLSFTPSSFAIAPNQKKAFQLDMNNHGAKQHDAYLQKQANITQRRSLGSKMGWAKRRAAAAEALAAAEAAVKRAEMDIVGQGQSSSGASINQSAHAHQVLAHAQKAKQTALDEYTALQHALEEVGMTASSSSAANYANENNGFAYAARANNRAARGNNGSASAASSASSTNASFQNFFRSFKP